MHSVWFRHGDMICTQKIKIKLPCKLKIIVHRGDETGFFICEDYNISAKMIYLSHEVETSSWCAGLS